MDLVPDYHFLPFNFTRLKGQHSVLMVNMVGEYLSLSNGEFNELTLKKTISTPELFSTLKAKHFICESLEESCIDLLATKYRTKKSFLFEFTSLHMVVVTLRCNQKCVYCHASSVSADKKKYDMSTDTAEKVIDICLRSPAPRIKIEFQGGEPLLNFETIKFSIEYATRKALQINKEIEFVVCSNLTVISAEMLEFFKEHDVYLSTSLDGPRHVHNYNRRYRNGAGTYDDFIRALDKTRNYLSHDKISALMTTTKYSLNYSKEIVDEYISQQFSTIFVRPLNPFGFAYLNFNKIGYPVSEFIVFYRNLFECILHVNFQNHFFEEAFASILLTRILTPFSTGFVDLQFPAGTGISGTIYDFDGNVYPSDEARMLAQMNNTYFCIGNVHHNTYEEIFSNDILKKLVSQSCAETLPGCVDCAFQLYCGIDPIRNYITQGEVIGTRPTNDLCAIHKSILTDLFKIILTNEDKYMDVFWSWLTGRHPSEIAK